MFDGSGPPLFAALEQQARSLLGGDHPCTLALARAAETTDPADIETAQKQLSELQPSEIEELMESAHKALREDPAALLGFWVAPNDPERKN